MFRPALRIFLATMILGPAWARAQLVDVLTLTAPDASTSFGERMAGDIDVNGDGVPDILVSDGNYPQGQPSVGRVTLHSGADGSVLQTIYPEAGVLAMGRRIAGIDDFDGDGLEDVLVIAREQAVGLAYVVSGSSGALIARIDGLPNETFGSDVARVADTDGDGRDGFVVGALGFLDEDAGQYGRIYVFENTSGSARLVINGEDTGLWFGYAVARGGDLDGDGIGDVLIGARGADESTTGRAFAHSGADGSRIRVFDAGDGSYQHGSAITSVGDWNGDDVADVAVGDPYFATFGGPLPVHGRIIVYSGATAAPLAVFLGEEPYSLLGGSFASIGDLNGDQVPDMLAGAPTNPFFGSGIRRLYAFSGSDGAVLLRFIADEGAPLALGAYVSSAGDVNGDGNVDIVLGGAVYGAPPRAYVQGFCFDGDGDGFGVPASALCASPAPDCNDADAGVNPGTVEIPGNGVDENCNGNDLCGSIPLADGSGQGSAIALFALAVGAFVAATFRRGPLNASARRTGPSRARGSRSARG